MNHRLRLCQFHSIQTILFVNIITTTIGNIRNNYNWQDCKRLQLADLETTTIGNIRECDNDLFD